MRLKTFFIGLINFYQRNISIFTKRSCVFYPTCSEYAKEVINKYGIGKGAYLSLRRILHCHPWTTPRIDNVP